MEKKKYAPMLVMPGGPRRLRRTVILKDPKDNKTVLPIDTQSKVSPNPTIIPVQSEGYIHAKRFDCL